MAELARLKYLSLKASNDPDEGALDFQSNGVDAVLLEIADNEKHKLANLSHGSGGNDGPPSVSTPTSTPEKGQIEPSVEAKILCSVSYSKQDREQLVQGAVDFVHRLKRQRQKEKVQRELTPPRPHSIKTLAESNFNKDMDNEVSELEALKAMRQWRAGFMAKMDRTSRVNETHTERYERNLKNITETAAGDEGIGEQDENRRNDVESDGVQPLDVQSLVDYFMKSTGQDQSHHNINDADALLEAEL
jgi:hypothetical protein